ncbi:MAG: hypothetical protein ACRDPF_40135, partial [Streptosporangiaceae bacterium]
MPSINAAQPPGGPAVKPPTHIGFGSKIIEASIAGQRSGRVQFEWRPEGLRCDIVIPHIATERTDAMIES